MPLRAQRRLRRVATLSATTAPHWDAFRDALQALGYREGKDLSLELRSADGKLEALPKLAADLVRSKPDVIVAHETAAVMAAKKATPGIPIVMAPAGDPVAAGLVASLARPGGNVTGVAANTQQIAGKLLELIREVKPNARRIAVLGNPNDPSTNSFVAQLQRAGARMRMTVGLTLARGAREYHAAFAEWDRLRVHAVIVQTSVGRASAVDLARQYRMLSVSPMNGFAEAGGLMSYSSSQRELGRKTASYVDRILKGARPGELAVEQATVFELALNLRTAKAIEVEFPDSVVARADVLIQ